MVKNHLIDILQKICNNVDRMFENGELYPELIMKVELKLLKNRYLKDLLK